MINYDYLFKYLQENRTIISVSTGIVLFCAIVYPRLHSILKCLQERFILQHNCTIINHGKDCKKNDSDIVISGIFIHPVKSLRAVSVSEAKLNSLGIKGDRMLMIVRPSPMPNHGGPFLPHEPTHRFVTQRQCAALATITASLPVEIISQHSKKTFIKLSVSSIDATTTSTKTNSNDNYNNINSTEDENKLEIFIDVNETTLLSNPVRYRAGIWDDVVDVVDLGDKAASFIQRIMKSDEDSFDDVRLVSMIPNITKRKTDGRYLPFAALNPFTGVIPDVSLTDGFPILIASEESLGELNRRLIAKKKKPLPMTRFRPNIVVKGLSKAFDEDSWKAIQIGGPSGPILHIVKGCPRCKQSCTDQVTGERDTEPLETLGEFRALGRNKEDVYFAQNAVIQHKCSMGYLFGSRDAYQSIRVGDSVNILTTGSPVWDINAVKAE